VQHGRTREELFNPSPAFRDAVPQRPEAPEKSERVRQGSDVIGEEPTDRKAKVTLLRLQSFSPFRLMRQGPLHALDELAEVGGMALCQYRKAGHRREQFRRELADGLEHAKSRTVLSRGNVDQTV